MLAKKTYHLHWKSFQHHADTEFEIQMNPVVDTAGRECPSPLADQWSQYNSSNLTSLLALRLDLNTGRLDTRSSTDHGAYLRQTAAPA